MRLKVRRDFHFSFLSAAGEVPFSRDRAVGAERLAGELVETPPARFAVLPGKKPEDKVSYFTHPSC